MSSFENKLFSIIGQNFTNFCMAMLVICLINVLVIVYEHEKRSDISGLTKKLFGILVAILSLLLTCFSMVVKSVCLLQL